MFLSLLRHLIFKSILAPKKIADSEWESRRYLGVSLLDE